jgi:hypothetical protein
MSGQLTRRCSRRAATRVSVRRSVVVGGPTAERQVVSLAESSQGLYT